MCRECNSATVVEVTCVECYETKGLNDFYKAQRRNPENAVSGSAVRSIVDSELS